MPIGFRWIFVAILAIGLADGHQGPTHKTKILTVCEALVDVNRYADMAVIVVGRLERSVSLVDHYEFLSQDSCGPVVAARGHPWARKIQLVTSWEKGMPKPPRDTMELDYSAVGTKLAEVRRTTELGTHEEPFFKTEGHSIVYSHTALVPNEWAAVYGRLVQVRDDAQLVILAKPEEVHRLRPDGTPMLNKQ